jgi:hypothetical protein
MSTKKRPVWKSGPPPSVGWWPASDCYSPAAIRYWNGSGWSCPCYRGDPMWLVEQLTKGPYTDGPRNVRWRARPRNWPPASLARPT